MKFTQPLSIAALELAQWFDATDNDRCKLIALMGMERDLEDKGKIINLTDWKRQHEDAQTDTESAPKAASGAE